MVRHGGGVVSLTLTYLHIGALRAVVRQGFHATYLAKRHRLPADVVGHAVWLYFRFQPELPDVEELLAQRGIEVSYKTIRC